MGKKSLFEPTGPDEPKAASKKKGKKTPALKKDIVGEQPLATEAAASVEPAPVTVPSPPSPTLSASAVREEVRMDAVDRKEPAVSAAPDLPLPAPSPESAPFEHDPLVSTNSLLKVVAAAAGLIMLILIVSMVNAGNYYVRESRGAVEIWKGNFSPAGQDRVMVLHGAHWGGKVKDSYSREEVFSFAAMSYLGQAVSLSEAPVSAEFDKIVYYLDLSLELIPDQRKNKAVAVINQARQQIVEAKILRASGEKEAVALGERKLETVSKALAGLVREMSEKAGHKPS